MAVALRARGRVAVRCTATAHSTVDDAEFTDNEATTGAGSGGAILLNGTSATATISGSTFGQNVGSRGGGAVPVD